MALYINGQLQTMMPASSISNIRYVEANDVVQLYYDGQWRDWKSGGMAYPVGTEIVFDYTGAVEEFIIPATGNWKLECWGAQGGGGGGESPTGITGGKGGYSKAVGYFDIDTALYIAVGQYGGDETKWDSGTRWNGGGRCYGWTSSSQGRDYASCGGGATHIATENRGQLKEYSQNTGDILIVAGGGGGGEHRWGGTSFDYLAYGGVGGGGNTAGGNGQTAQSGATAGTGGTLSSGGTGYYSGSFGQGAPATSSNAYYSGGGGGFYGGGAGGNASYVGTGGGGSGYIKSTLTDTVGNNGVREGAGQAKLTYLGIGG